MFVRRLWTAIVLSLLLDDGIAGARCSNIRVDSHLSIAMPRDILKHVYMYIVIINFV